MERKEIYLIINPVSGTTDKEAAESYLTRRLSERGYVVTVRMTRGRGDATEFAAEAASAGVSGVVVLGGDGTVNEVATALCNTGIPMGILPSGSGNGLARHLCIPLDIRAATDIIMDGYVEDCDYATVCGQSFFCTSGVGFDAMVSEKFAGSQRRGKMSYVRIALREYLKYNPEQYTIIAGGEVITEKALVVAVCNSSQYGNNAYIAPHASMTDGLLDITIIHFDNLLTTAFSGIDMLTGYLDKGVNTITLRAPAVTIVREKEGPVHFDGEPAMMGKELKYECHHGGLKILCPRDPEEFKPLLTPLKSLVTDLRHDIRQALGINQMGRD